MLHTIARIRAWLTLFVSADSTTPRSYGKGGFAKCDGPRAKPA